MVPFRGLKCGMCMPLVSCCGALAASTMQFSPAPKRQLAAYRLFRGTINQSSQQYTFNPLNIEYAFKEEHGESHRMNRCPISNATTSFFWGVFRDPDFCLVGVHQPVQSVGCRSLRRYTAWLEKSNPALRRRFTAIYPNVTRLPPMVVAHLNH